MLKPAVRRPVMVAVSALVAFLVLSSLLAFYQAVRPPKINSNIVPGDLGLQYEDVTVTTSDGLELSAWFVPLQNGSADVSEAPTIIALHGYPADKGDILPVVAPLAADFNLLLLDLRYFGDSGGAYSSLGAKETEDLRAAVDYLKDEKGVDKVGVWGFSYGAAVAIMAAPETPEIRAIYAEASFANLHDLSRQLFRVPVLDVVLAEMTALWARLFVGINSREVSPADSARELDIPIIIAHSRGDEMIPFAQGQKLEASLRDNPNAVFVFSDSGVHGQQLVSPERLREFFLEHLR